MSQKSFEDQFDDENVLMVFRKHPIVMRKGLIYGSFALLAPMLYILALTYMPSHFPTMSFFGLMFLLGIFLGFVVFFPAWIAWYYSVFIVTDQRFIQITQKGLFHRSVVDIGINQIQMVNYEIAGFQETLLGYGTLMMQTYMGELLIHDVHHPSHIQKKMLNILRKQGIITMSDPPMGADNKGLTSEEQDQETN